MSINQCSIHDIPEKVLNDTLDMLMLLSMSWLAVGIVLGALVYHWVDWFISYYMSRKYCQCNKT